MTGKCDWSAKDLCTGESTVEVLPPNVTELCFRPRDESIDVRYAHSEIAAPLALPVNSFDYVSESTGRSRRSIREMTETPESNWAGADAAYITIIYEYVLRLSESPRAGYNIAM